VAIDPYCSKIIFAGTGEQDGEPDGIYQSVDAGDTWQLRYSKDLDLVREIVIDSMNPLYIYAVGYGIAGSPEYNGFVKSTNGGISWTGTHVGRPGPTDNVYRLAVSSDGVDPPVMYTIVEDAPSKDVYRSTDRGDSWERLRIPNLPSPPPYVLAVYPFNRNYFYVNSNDADGILHLVDMVGLQYYTIGDGLPVPPERPSSILTHPDNPNMVYLGFPNHGIFKAEAWPPAWSPAVQGLNNTYINDLAVDPTSSQTVYAAIKSAVTNTGHHLAITKTGGDSWNYLTNSPNHLNCVSIDPQVPANIYVGNSPYYGSFFFIHYSPDSGQSWSDKRFLYVTPGSIGLGVGDIWIDPRNSDTILVAGAGTGGPDNGGGIYKTIDGGMSWARTSNFWAETLTADPANPSVLYYGSQHCGYVFRSANTGGSWTNISPSAPDDQCWVWEVRALEVDSNSRVYAATDEGLWKRTSGIWTQLNGLPTEDITSLAIDRSEIPQTIYVGTGNDGVYFSRDEGGPWIPINEGLEKRSITHLAISTITPKILYAGTAYGGVWQYNVSREPCEGDINEDQKVDHLDLQSFADDLGKQTCNGGCDGDCDGDHDADGQDLATIISDYGRTDCPAVKD
jgi:hypothetical protein